MKKFIYKYNLEMLSVFLIIEFALTMIYRTELSQGRIIAGVFALLIMFHEWEELRFPGGFFDLMSGPMGVDLSKVDMGKCHLPTKILILVFSVVPLIFDKAMIIVFVPIILMIFEMFVHIMGIFIHKMDKPYTPGMVTGVIMGVYAIYAAYTLLSTGLARATDILIAIPIFFLCFMAMGLGIIKLIGLNFDELRKNMMKNKK